VLPASDDPERFTPGSRLCTQDGRELVVVSCSRYRDRGLIVRFDGVVDRDAAEELRGSIITIPDEARRNLDAGEFWTDDLVGLEAVSPAGEVLGVVASVELGSAQDRVIVITPDGREIQVPFVDEIVGDPEDGRLEIRDPGGLFE